MINLVKLWILASAACVATGWILSAFHELNLAGYAVCFAIFAAGLFFICRRKRRTGPVLALRWKPRRFRRPLPLIFLLTAILAAIGGAVHAPNNYDAMTYRFPRVLHWWAASGWHWIATPIDRLNLSGTGFEWLMMPLFVLTHGDRLFFLINVAAYFLLPGLIFVVFVTSGVSRRVAWFWMWLLPAALCYAMQAGSISNDTIATTYFLAAIYFAFQARRTWRVGNLWLSFLAAGLLTGVKASNLPLLLPIAWAVWPAMRLVGRRIVGSAAVVLLAALVSFVPVAALNRHYTGDWSGDPGNLAKLKEGKPLVGIMGNGLQLGLQSLEPPFLPLARTVESWVWQHFPPNVKTTLEKDFPRFGVGFRELPQEESAGVGIGIAVIAIVSTMTALNFRFRSHAYSSAWIPRQGLMIGLLTWVALMVYMTKLSSESTSRLIAAYYPMLLLPLVLTRAQGYLVRRHWYEALGIGAGLIALVAVILTPSRPLWPAGHFFDWAVARFPNSRLMAHAREVYDVYNTRNDVFAGLRSSIPESAHVIGLIEGGDDAETSLWRPFGTRRVVDVLDAGRIRESKLQWVVVKDSVLALQEPKGLEDWLRRNDGTLVAQYMVTEKVGAGREQWSVVRFSQAPDRNN